MVLKLDVKDRRILYELDRNARQPASKIARHVGLSTDAIGYRIKQLVKNNAVFKFMTLLDTAKLGLTTYKIFYRFQNTTPEKEEEIIEYLRKHPNTQYVTSTEGMFDLNINVLASSVKELNNILKEINIKYSYYFAERQVNIIVEANFFFRDYLINKKSDEIRKPMFFGSHASEAKIDEKDRKILKMLARNARQSAVDISKHSKLSSDAVIQRIKNLEKSGLIQNYVLYPNSDKIGYKSYFVLLRFRDLNQDKEKRFFTYCNLQSNIWFYAKLIGQWDCVINIETENEIEFRKIMSDIKKDFSEILKEYYIFKFVKTYKFDMYPIEI